MVLAVQSRPHTMHAAIRGMGGAVLAKDGLTLVIDEIGLFINHRTQAPAGVDAWVRLFKNGTEVPVDPHRIFINPPLIHDRIFGPCAAFVTILWDSVLKAPNPKGWRTRGTVTTIFADAADDAIASASYASSPSWAKAIAGTGNDFTLVSGAGWFNSTAWLSVGVYREDAQPYWEVDQSFVSFDTSALGDSDSVDQVDFSVVDDNATYSYARPMATSTIEVRVFDWSTSVTTADWRTTTQYAALTRVATFASGSWTDNARNTFTEDGTNFRSAINKTGTTRLMMASSLFQSSQPADNTFAQAALLSANTTGTTNDPKLIITHTAGATANGPLFGGRKLSGGILSGRLAN